MDDDLRSLQAVRDSLRRASAAQRQLAKLSQADIDGIVAAMAAAGEQAAEALGRLAHEETGYGKAADKTIKNLFSVRTVHGYIRGLRTVGVLREDPARGIIEIGCPKGVVAAIIPSTNPTSTALFKCLIAIKAACSIVISPHPSARRCIRKTAEVMAAAAVAAGAPAGCIECLEEPSEAATQELMRHRLTGVILATGGMGLVRAAYSAGKPAFGVGPGNVPAFIERTANVAKAVRDVVTGTTFDNGTICASEQALVIDSPIKAAVISELVRNAAHMLTPEQAQAVGELVILPSGRVNPVTVGRPAAVIAALAGIDVPTETSVLVAELESVGRDQPLSLEKLSPILALYTEDGWERGCDRCMEILRAGGLGHTLAIHSNDERVIREFGLQKPVFRIIVNSPATHGAIGYSTDLAPSMTLGCGALGGNITSDNITPLHLIDIKRLAWETRPVDLAAEVPDGLAAAGSGASVPRASKQAGVGPERRRVESVVERFWAGREAPASQRSPAPTTVRPAAPPAAAPPPLAAPQPISEFVCEEDIRQALASAETIHINAATIVTPAAWDLAGSSGVLRRVD